jgi:acyl-homoserine-lactone acylase
MLFGNVMYADRRETHSIFTTARFRRVDPKFDWQKPVDGSDPATEWKGYHTMRRTAATHKPENGLDAELQHDSVPADE